MINIINLMNVTFFIMDLLLDKLLITNLNFHLHKEVPNLYPPTAVFGILKSRILKSGRAAASCIFREKSR